jgi:undecaprenyl-diphosphatase
MTILQAIILGIVQGLTEFLPISSSGHLLIVPWLFNWHFLLENPDLNKTFDVALHFGTFISLVVYFWHDIGRLLTAWAGTITRRRLDSPDGRLAWLIIVSMIPAAIVGVLFEDVIVDVLGKPWMLALLMIAFGGVMWAADRYARHERELDTLRWKDAVLIGAAQALALSPGVSRSGVTMVTGLFLRLTREAAARFSFLMSIPIVGGAALYKGLEVARDGLPPGTAGPFLAGMAAAAVSGFAAIWFLLAYLRKHDFTIFVLYRFAIGFGMIILIVTGVRSGMGI